MDRSKSPSVFEKILQEQSIKKPSVLYDIELNLNEENYRPQDVIKSVYNQIKALQKADCLQIERDLSKNINCNASKSQFLPVNKLPVYATGMQEVPKANVAKLDTQCYLDTQIMDIIDCAEAIESNTGMTQEFDTTFAHIDDTNTEDDDDNSSTKNAYDISKNVTLGLEQNSMKLLKNRSKDQDIFMSENSSDTEDQKKYDNTDIDDTITFIQDNISKDPADIEELDETIKNAKETTDEINKENPECVYNEMDLDTGQYSQAPPSPVLNMKSLNKELKAPSPLVVSLETFENFETLAMSLIEETDFKTAKHLINSQILGKELCLNEDDLLFQRNSPVLDYKSDELQIKFDDFILSPERNTNMLKLQNINDVIEKSSDIFEDEIIFSTDEEDSNIKEDISCKNLIDVDALSDQQNEIDYQKDNNYKELPLTCALEMSDDESGGLDNSLFVGFQTASNKSIQIHKNSFEKAQSIFCGDKNAEKNNLNELVAKCDRLKSYIDPIKQSSKNEKDILMGSKSLPISLGDTVNIIIENKTSHKGKFVQENISSSDSSKEFQMGFIGFQTASHKKINKSNKALEKCRAVFQDIDLSENFHIQTKSVQLENNLTMYKTANVNEIEDDKINDELLLQEFENIEMSLEKEDSESIKNSPYQDETGKNNNIIMSHDTESEKKFQDFNLKLHKRINEKYQEMKATRDINEPSTSSDMFVGFKTASSKEIKITEEALAKTKDVFKDLGKDKKTIITIEDIMSPTSTNKSIEGFKTASNKHINISDAALTKTKQIFGEIDKEEIQISFLKPSLNTQKKTEFVEVKAVKNKNNKITEQSLCKTKNIFKEDTPTSKAFVGFKTARNNNIFISKVALAESKKIFESIDKEDTKNNSTNAHKLSDTHSNKACDQSDDDSSITLPKHNKVLLESEEDMFMQCDFDELEPIFRGFENPNLKTDKTTEQIVESCKKILDENFTETKEFVCFENKTIIQSPGKAFAGFITGHNKVVNISAEALEQSKKQMDSIGFGDKSLADQHSGKHPMFQGFQTASKKTVSISAEALEKSKRMLHDIDENNDCIPEKVPKVTEKFEGFQTASKKPVNVNADALIASKKLFDDIHVVKDFSKKSFVGFKTANNKNVDISADAIAKCKKLFNDIDDLPLTSVNTSKETKYSMSKGIDKNKSEMSKDETKTEFIGFQTASNNKVTVSKQALAKTIQLFKDLNNETDISSMKNGSDIASNIDVSKKAMLKENFGFQTGRNKEVIICDDALIKSKKVFADDIKSKRNIVTDAKAFKLPVRVKNYPEANSDIVDIEGMIDTQVINNFDMNLCTEDFRETPKPNKRSGSPILSCPKAKRRKKFETPYKINPNTVKRQDHNEEVTQPENALSFCEDYKKNKIYTLIDVSKLEKGKNKNIDPYLSNFNIENMQDFEFDEHRNDLKDGKLMIEEIKQLFTEATDKKLIPDGWIDIQLKLIIWKLISYEIRFPETIGKVCTVRNVIDQLKYRYDKELYNAERPILRKILEKDDVPVRTMVLCVAGIYVDGRSVASVTSLNNIELLLTDGWYFIMATIDNMLSKLVYDGKISVGCKIVTCSAELMNCEQGVAPWEDTSSIRLSISGNSTLPAPWHAKLGLRPTTLLSRLKSVQVGGGKVSRLRVRVTRVYPSLYVEKFPDGSTVTRSERLEHQYQTKYEAENEAMIEKIYEEVEKEMSDQESQDSELVTSGKRRCYETGSQIAKMMKACKDPMEFRGQLTSSQIHLLQEHMSNQRDKYLQIIQSRVAERVRSRNVVTLAKGRVVGLERDGDTVSVTRGMLSIWKPNDEVLDIFKEGAWIEVTNVVPTAFRNSDIQLSAGRQSVFRPLKRKEDIFEQHLATLSRMCHLIKDLSLNPGMVTEYNEIDTAGIIFSIDPPTEEFNTKNQFQNVYLADIDKNMVVVNFWGGIKKFGYENILDTGQVVCCSNLQKRAGNTRKNIPQYRATEFSLFTKTPKNEKAREIVDEMHKKFFALDRRKFCEDCIAVKQTYSMLKCFGDNQNVTPYRFNKSEYNLVTNNMFIDTPVGSTVKCKVEDFNLTGLDFESTFRQPDTQELSPKTLQRKKKVNERIAKLKMYGEPPPLSPINIVNKSKNAANSYKSPLVRNEAVASNDCESITSGNNAQNISTPIKLSEICADDCNEDLASPVIPLNRTYVKSSGVNPVKLNFSGSSNMDKSVDHFAEEFDGSPPLSLE